MASADLRARPAPYDRLLARNASGTPAPNPVVVHALWSGKSLCLWGEDPVAAERMAESEERRKRGSSLPRTRDPEMRPHPFALSATDLLACVAGLGAPIEDRGEVELDWVLDLALPTAAGAPVPSPRLLIDGERHLAARATSLAGWTVPALVLPACWCIDWLAGLSALDAPAVVGAGSLRYYSELAKLAFEFALRGRVLPAFEKEDGQWRTVWLPAPDVRTDGERLAALRDALPPLARAEIGRNRDTGLAGGDPGELFGEAFRALVDAAARDCLLFFDKPWSRRGKKREQLPAEILLEALTELAPDAEPSRQANPTAFSRALGLCEQNLGPWLEPARPDRQGNYRTCFRLTAPRETPDDRDAPWRLDFLLQAADDPSLQIPASQVWGTPSRTLRLPGGRLEDPQERLLADLGRAALLYPTLSRALKTARPQNLLLDATGAYEFLSTAAPVLEGAGFGVLVPPWWHKRERQVGVRLKAHPKESATGSGLLGLEGLCAYEWEVAVGDRALTLAEFKALAAQKVPLVQVRGEWVELRQDQVASALEFFKKRQADGEMSATQVLRVGLGIERSPAGLPVLGVVAEGWLADLLGGAASDAIKPIPTPEAFAGTLRPYQQRGLAWLAFCARVGLGACLADDMGLGKTVQLLALLAHERAASGRGPANGAKGRPKSARVPTLLIAPMSVVGNWEREASRFCPDLKALVHHGPDRATGGEFAAMALRHDLVITTYNLAVRDADDLGRITWHRVVLDEAQNIKNHATRQSQAIRSLPCRGRVALSGTPVENRLAELWSIMDFLNPGLLGSREDFRTRFESPIERYHDADRADLLRKLLGPVVLRRKKTDRTIIQDLPDKMEMKVFCNLTREQATLYQAVVTDMLEQIERTEGIQRKGLVLATMLKLKQVCNHPAQFLQDRSEIPGRSGKLDRLEETLDEALALCDKALVFTQFAEMGHLLVAHLQRRLGRTVPFLHGGTPKAARDAMVARFQESDDTSVLLLSLKAGGTGLNLTAANHVIHFDRWWNPAVEDQATDRAFRIGQLRNVQVRKFVCVGTLEERIDRMIEEKRDLAERVVGTGEGWLTELSTAQLRELFALAEREAVGE